MQASDAFKLGFLTRCVEEGLSPEQTCALAKQAGEKQAAWPKWLGGKGKVGAGAAGAAGGVAAGLGGALPGAAAAVVDKVTKGWGEKWFWPALGLLVTAPAAVGGLAAYLAHQASNTDNLDVDDVQEKELAVEYDRMRDDLVRRKKLRDHRQALPAPKSIYL